MHKRSHGQARGLILGLALLAVLCIILICANRCDKFSGTRFENTTFDPKHTTFDPKVPPMTSKNNPVIAHHAAHHAAQQAAQQAAHHAAQQKEVQKAQQKAVKKAVTKAVVGTTVAAVAVAATAAATTAATAAATTAATTAAHGVIASNAAVGLRALWDAFKYKITGTISNKVQENITNKAKESITSQLTGKLTEKVTSPVPANHSVVPGQTCSTTTVQVPVHVCNVPAHNGQPATQKVSFVAEKDRAV